MSKTKNGFLFGAIVLAICNLISKFISAIYKVPLLKTLGSEGLGQYQMIFPIYALFLVISSSGIIVAISKLTSKQTEVQNNRNARKYFFAGFLISLISSTFFSIVLFVLSPALSKIQSNYNLTKLYLAVIPAIILGSLISAFRGYFLGRKKMTYSGLMQIVGAVLKLIFSLGLSVLFATKGFTMAVFGALAGLSIAELFSFGFALGLYYFSRKRLKTKYAHVLKHKYEQDEKQKIDVKKLKIIKKNEKNGKNLAKFNNFYSYNRYISFKKAFKDVLNFSFFVTLEACIMPLVGAIDSLVVVPLLLKSGLNHAVAFSLYGLEDGIVSSIVSLPTFVATAIGASIIPNIKKENISNEKTIKNIQMAFSIVWIVSIFCAFVFMTFSKEITLFLYGSGLSVGTLNELSIASDLLKINSFNIIYLSFIIISTSILQALEKNKIPVLNLFCGAIFRLLALFVLVSISNINIYGTAICDAIFYSVALVLNLKAIKKLVCFKLNITKYFLLPITSCVVMSMVMKLLNFILAGLISSRMLTLIVLLFGVSTYAAFLVVTKVVNLKEIFFVIKKKQEV